MGANNSHFHSEICLIMQLNEESERKRRARRERNKLAARRTRERRRKQEGFLAKVGIVFSSISVKFGWVILLNKIRWEN